MPQNAELQVPELDAFPFPSPVVPDILVSFSPTVANGSRIGPGVLTTTSVTAIISGGAPPYEFEWNRLAGHSQLFDATSPDEIATTFFADAPSAPATLLDFFELTVTDFLDNTGSGILHVNGTVAALPAFTVSFAPPAAGVTITGPGVLTTNFVTGSASGGSGSYESYLWERMPGGSQAFEATDPTSPTTAFVATALTAPTTFADVFRLTVTDSLGGTTFAGLNVSGAANAIPPPPEHIISPVFPPVPPVGSGMAFGMGGGYGEAQRVAALLDRVGEIVLLRRPSTGFEIYIRAKQVELVEPNEIADVIIGRHRRFALSALRLQQAGWPLPLEARDQIIDPRDKLYTIVAVQCQARNETQIQYWVIAAGDA